MTTNTPYGSVFWLGGYRNYAAPYKKQSSWLWSDGAEMNFTAWAPGQPNNFWSDRVSIDIISIDIICCSRWGERCIRSVNTDLDLDTAHRTWDDHRCWLRAANSLVCKLALD